MGLTGEEKKDYQRKYMQARRSNKEDGSNKEGLTLSNGVYIDKEKAIKLARIHNALNKRITGLDGPESMLDLVRYGDFTMREVGVMLVSGEVL